MRKIWEILRTNWQQQRRANTAMNECKAFCCLEETLRNTIGSASGLKISGERNESAHPLQLTLKHATTIAPDQYWKILCTLKQINEQYRTQMHLRFEENQ